MPGSRAMWPAPCGWPRVWQPVCFQSALGDHAAGVPAHCGGILPVVRRSYAPRDSRHPHFRLRRERASLYSDFSARTAKLWRADGFWAAWAWAFFPYGIYFSAAWAWSTHLLLLCLCWLLYLEQSMEKSARLGLWAGFGLLAGFTALTEPSSLVLARSFWRWPRGNWRTTANSGWSPASSPRSPWPPPSRRGSSGMRSCFTASFPCATAWDSNLDGQQR